MTKPMSRKSYNVARVDSNKETKRIVTAELRPTTTGKGVRFVPCGNLDHWTITMNRLNTKTTRTLNDELGLNTKEGIAQWYKKI